MTRNSHALKEAEIKLTQIDLENQGIVFCSRQFGKTSKLRQGPKSKDTKDINKSKEKYFPCLVCRQNTHWILLGCAQL